MFSDITSMEHDSQQQQMSILTKTKSVTTFTFSFFVVEFLFSSINLKNLDQIVKLALI